MTKLSKLLLPVVFTTALLTNQILAANKCYALALSSGQENAAYQGLKIKRLQVGVLKGLLSKVPSDQMKYQTVTGISGGAVNAAILGQHAQGNETGAVDEMTNFWKAAASTKLYQNWWGGIVSGLFTAGGIYDNAPLISFLKTQFINDKQFSRETSVGIVDVLEGQFETFDSKDLSDNSQLLDVLYASFSFPGFFPPAEVFDSKFFDGSAVYDIDIFTAINKCLGMGFTEENIIVDVAFTSSANLKEVDAEDYRSIGMLFRYLEISSFYSSMDGLLRARFSYPKVNFRYAVSPSKSLPSSLYPLNLNADQIQQIIDVGFADAQTAVTSKASVDHLIHYYKVYCKNSIIYFICLQFTSQYHYLKSKNDNRIDSMTYGFLIQNFIINGEFVEAKLNKEYDFDSFDMRVIETDPSYIQYKLKFE